MFSYTTQVFGILAAVFLTAVVSTYGRPTAITSDNKNTEPTSATTTTDPYSISDQLRNEHKHSGGVFELKDKFRSTITGTAKSSTTTDDVDSSDHPSAETVENHNGNGGDGTAESSAENKSTDNSPLSSENDDDKIIVTTEPDSSREIPDDNSMENPMPQPNESLNPDPTDANSDDINN